MLKIILSITKNTLVTILYFVVIFISQIYYQFCLILTSMINEDAGRYYFHASQIFELIAFLINIGIIYIVFKLFKIHRFIYLAFSIISFLVCIYFYILLYNFYFRP